MIVRLTGTVVEKSPSRITIATNSGVGYEVNVTPLTAGRHVVDEELTLFTYLRVTENAHELYGFSSGEEREFFALLLSVSGVGPKTAMNILALGSIKEIESAIARADVQYLTAVQGMGKKTAERLVVELKAKMEDRIHSLPAGEAGSQFSVVGSDVLAEVIEGLVTLGYSREEAKQAVRGIETENKNAQEVLRLALKSLSR